MNHKILLPRGWNRRVRSSVPARFDDEHAFSWASRIGGSVHPEPILYCDSCRADVRCEPGVQKKASKVAAAGTEIWRCPACGRALGMR